MQTKICAACKQILSISLFNVRKHQSGNMGYDAWCRSCRHKYSKWYKKAHYTVKETIPPLTRAQINARDRKRYQEDPNYKLKRNLRKALYDAITRNERSQHTLELLGCSIESFKQHLEALFLPGMTWDNWSQYGWHIDHIKPISSFDLIDTEQQKICFHYTNMQPLWWRDNLSKGNTI